MTKFNFNKNKIFEDVWDEYFDINIHKAKNIKKQKSIPTKTSKNSKVTSLNQKEKIPSLYNSLKNNIDNISNHF